MSDQLTLPSITAELQLVPGAFGSLGRKLRAILRIYAQKGIPLRVLCDAQHLNRSWETPTQYARKESLIFPD